MTANLAVGLGEPQVAVGAAVMKVAIEFAASRRREFARRGHAIDHLRLITVTHRFSSARCDPERHAASGQRELRDVAAGRDAADFRQRLREPDVAFGAERHHRGTAVGRQDRKFLDLAGRRSLADAIRRVLGEPQVAVAASDDFRGPRARGSSNSVRVPAVLSRPMRLPECSVNHRLPSAPNVIPAGPLSE